MTERLHLLPSIAFNRHDDPDREQWLQDQRAPFLVRGYRLVELEDDSFQAIVNEHIEHVLDTMLVLLSLLPEMAVLGLLTPSDEPEWLPQRPLEGIREVMRSFDSAITEDPNLELVVEPEDRATPQVHLADGKVLVVTAPNASRTSFQSMMERLRMPEVPDLATVDEFPRTMINPSGATATLVEELGLAIERIA